MREIANMGRDRREELFLTTSRKIGLPEAMVEKDFWVCWTLDYLFHFSPWKDRLAFKGGTSLSKCFGLIKRFSEDIDLILDWRVVGCEKDEPWDQRSKNQQDKYNKAVNARTEVFLSETLIPRMKEELSAVLNDSFGVSIDRDDPQTVCFDYPRLFSEGAILPTIRLEIGALAAWTPTQDAMVMSFAAEQFPHVFRQTSTTILTVSPERTFWEKATILHKEAFRENGKIPPRYSRHYYDVWCMEQSPVCEAALRDVDLLQRVVAFKDRFYPAASAHYELAKPGTIRLMPPADCIPLLHDDYEHMKRMIFGTRPEFDEILSEIRKLEVDINAIE